MALFISLSVACLNPYSTGSNSNTDKQLGRTEHVPVLILILLEVTQISQRFMLTMPTVVLILILLEVTQISTMKSL